ncbi:MAG: LysR family transcriptional regulator [Azospirillaceae bacterium]|nr:LysR family transcriptional regulator [Azospirillaceae bacterium]
MESSFDWDALQSFLAVVRTGRLTAAARRMGVDHTTLGRRIADLERALQAQLFTRSVQGYALTPQGEKLLASAQAMESLALGVMEDVAGSSLKVAGSVRIGAPDGFGTLFLARHLAELGERHPDLRLELVTMPRLFSLTKREADIAIGLAPPQEGRLHARKLTDYQLGLYATDDYLARHGEPTRRADLRGHRLIGYVGDLIYAPELDYIPLIGPPGGRDLAPSITSSNLLAQYQMTLAGHGLCVLPCFMAAPDTRLRRVMVDAVSLTRSFWLIVHSDLRDLARVRITTDFIVEAVRAAGAVFMPE